MQRNDNCQVKITYERLCILVVITNDKLIKCILV